MSKKNIINLGILLIGIILVIFIVVFMFNKKTIIDIEMQSNDEQKILYNLKINSDGNYKLTINTKLSEDSEETEITYDAKLTDLELEKVNTIIKYVKENANLKENKAFKYNYEKDTNYSEETLGILENLLIALENISMNEIKIGEVSRREFGNTMLDNIISTQL